VVVFVTMHIGAVGRPSVQREWLDAAPGGIVEEIIGQL